MSAGAAVGVGGGHDRIRRRGQARPARAGGAGEQRWESERMRELILEEGKSALEAWDIVARERAARPRVRTA